MVKTRTELGVRFPVGSDIPIVEPKQGDFGFGELNLPSKKELIVQFITGGKRQLEATAEQVNDCLKNLTPIDKYPNWLQLMIEEQVSWVFGGVIELYPKKSKKGRQNGKPNAIAVRTIPRIAGKSRFNQQVII